MKKVFLTLACVSFLAFSITSCEKTCTCTTTNSSEYIPDSTFEGKIKGKCADLDSKVEQGGFTVETTCK